MGKTKILALIGKSGAGKDTILHSIFNPAEHHEIVSYTTRPPRDGEIDGINYHFITDDEFLALVRDGKMLEYTEFRKWYYGTGIDDLDPDKINIGVFNPAGARALLAREDLEVLVIYIKATAKSRLLRQLLREEHPDVNEIVRRYLADEADFNTIDFPYEELWNDDLDLVEFE